MLSEKNKSALSAQQIIMTFRIYIVVGTENDIEYLSADKKKVLFPNHKKITFKLTKATEMLRDG